MEEGPWEDGSIKESITEEIHWRRDSLEDLRRRIHWRRDLLKNPLEKGIQGLHWRFLEEGGIHWRNLGRSSGSWCQ